MNGINQVGECYIRLINNGMPQSEALSTIKTMLNDPDIDNSYYPHWSLK